MLQDAPSLGRSSVPWEPSSVGMETAKAAGALEEWIDPDPVPGMLEPQLRVPRIPGYPHWSCHPTNRGTLGEGLPGTLAQQWDWCPGEGRICSRGSPKPLPRSIPMPRVGDPLTSALLPGKIPSAGGRMLDTSTSPHRCFCIPVPDLKLQVVFQPRKSRLFPHSSTLSSVWAELLPCRQSQI